MWISGVWVYLLPLSYIQLLSKGYKIGLTIAIFVRVFGGFGVNFVNVKNETTTGYAATAGLINTFRVCKQLDINLELKGILPAGHDMPRGINA